jgi:peptidoglycan/xylan/chitin deacetylase (PgdA/CDA1 family)
MTLPMTRRDLLRGAGLMLGGAALGTLHAGTTRGRIALTVDDPQHQETPLFEPTERDRRIRAALRDAGVKAALFVTGKRVDDRIGDRLLRAWDVDGHLLGNHTYSHRSLNSDDITAEWFTADIAKGEKVVAGSRRFRKLFRYPYLKEGDSAAKRDAVRAWLDARGYKVGHVTVDASDWYIDQRLRARLDVDKGARTEGFRDFYLAHIDERIAYYDGLAVELLGASPPHTLLLHHNLLNALYLGDLIEHLRAAGWSVIDAETAFADPLYARRPASLPAGESLIWALARESGRYESRLRYPAEDAPYEAPAMDQRGL